MVMDRLVATKVILETRAEDAQERGGKPDGMENGAMPTRASL